MVSNIQDVNFRKKHMKETLSLWIVCVLAFLMATTWFYLEVDLLENKADIKQAIIVVDDYQGVVLGEEQLNELVEKLEQVKMTRQTFALKEKGAKYAVELYDQKTKKTKSILFHSETEIQVKHTIYKVKSGKISFEYLADLSHS